MDIIEKNARLMMATAQLAMTPNYTFPEGYRMRSYQPGDEAAWLQILSASERYETITREDFHSIGTDEVLLTQQVGFLVDPAGRDIGTATAKIDAKWQNKMAGWVHWVAIVPTWQGKGLAKPMLSAVCQRLLQQSQTEAYLYTSTARIPAINLYRSFGFEAMIINEEERQLWRDLAPYLKLPLFTLEG